MDPKRSWGGSGASAPGPPPKRQHLADEDADDARFDSFDLAEEDADLRLLEEDLEVELGAAGRNWLRPAAPVADPKRTALSELQEQGKHAGLCSDSACSCFLLTCKQLP